MIERFPQTANKLRPCERCKTQHLKCVYQEGASICQRCERSGNQCLKSTKKLRFRDVPASGIRNGRKRRKALNDSSDPPKENKDQFEDSGSIDTSGKSLDAQNFPWTAGSLERQAFTKNVFDNGSSERNAAIDRSASSDYSFMSADKSIGHVTNADIHGFDGLSTTDSTVLSASNGNHSSDPPPTHTRASASGSMDKSGPSSMSGSPSQLFGGGPTPQTYLDDMVKIPTVSRAGDAQSYLETILLRYFRQELAPWFDICDPFHHFADVLPQSARENGPLRNAILTISARNLSHNEMFRSSTGMVEWRGHTLPNLSEEMAITYHNECIRELLRLSNDHQKLCDETLLAAVVILRTDEEMLHEFEDKELFLRIASLFINAQLPLHLTLPHTSPQIFHSTMHSETAPSPLSPITSDLKSSGLRQACFWTSLRQDLHAAFLKQQSVKFPLARCEDFRQLGPATDAVWAHRMVVYCADVLEFCYGSESIDAKVLPAYTNRERWQQLRSQDQSLCASLPSSFEPVHCREPDRGQNEVFPSVLYLETTHVSGSTYMELARMLLCWFNPSIPKLGLGSQRATKGVLASTRKVLFRLCGIALSNSTICPPGLVNAALGIGLFGEYFEESLERNALLGVLSIMVQRYNYYPSARINSLLCQSWLADDAERLYTASIPSMDVQ